MCKTYLDDLVLANCAAQLKSIDRIFHEGVNHRFANILKSTYTLNKIRLQIDNKERNAFYLPKLDKKLYTLSDTKQRNISAARSTRDNSSRQSLEVSEDNLRDAVALILSRYNRLRCLKLAGNCGEFETDCILTVFREESCDIRAIHRLEYQLNATADFDARLIEHFSSTLQSLTFRCNISPPTQWAAVAKCTNLKTLSYIPDSPSNYIPPSPRMLKDHFLICIKQLQLETFRIRCQHDSKYLDADWLASAFEKNERLKKLIIHSSDPPTSALSAPNMLPIVRRLRTVAMDFYAFPTEETLHDLEVVMRNLAGDNYLTAQHDLRTEAEFKVIPEVALADSALQSWLRLSERTRRTIHLTFVHSRPASDSFTDQVLLTLAENPEFAEISVHQRARETILQFRDANIVLRSFSRV